MNKAIILNEYQTPIEELNLESLNPEIQEQFWDFFYNIPFIQSLVSSERPRACDLPRDKEGKIIVDITKPHILEDMDYFRPSAIHYQKFGCYTKLRPNGNPNSEFGRWIREEARRCREGYVRESDGEWITGDYYYFLNYAPMQLVKKKDKKDKKGQRVFDFPSVWEGHYLKFHAINLAREHGHHYAELASRSKGKSYCAASMLTKRFILGESEEVNKKVTCYITADDKKYLVSGDQTLDKFQYNIDWAADNMEFPSLRLINSLTNMQWIMGYKDSDSGTNKGTLNSVIGVTSKDDPAKLRGSRGVLYVIEEFGTFPALKNLWGNLLPSVEEGEDVFGLIMAYGCCCAGTKVWTGDGRNINIEDLTKDDTIVGYGTGINFTGDMVSTYSKGITKEPIGKLIQLGTKQCVEISFKSGNILRCSVDHPILTQKVSHPRVSKNDSKRYTIYSDKFIEAGNLKVGDKVCRCREIPVFGNSTLFDARLVGMLIGDGSYGYNNTPKYSSEDEELLSYIKNKYKTGLNASHITKKGFRYEEIRIKNICALLREIGIYGQTKCEKRLPINYQTLNEENTVLLLSGLYDTDGCIHVGSKINNDYIALTQSNKEILEQVQLLWKKFGVTSSIVLCKPNISENRKDKKPWYNLLIKGGENLVRVSKTLQLLVSNKKQKLFLIGSRNSRDLLIRKKHYNTNYLFDKVVNIKSIGEQTIYNLSAGLSHTYLANDIITHNTAGDNESDFGSAQELVYNPKGYHIEAFPNVYDKIGQGKTEFAYFFPGYLNLANCYDVNGNSDVTKAILSILKDRFTVKYNTTDLNAVTKRIAEIPITPQEAMLRTKGNIFPITQLNERLNEIDNNPDFYNDVYVGKLVMKQNGVVEFMPTNDMPIRNFPLQNNNEHGAIEIYEMPQKGPDGKPIADRYIVGHDPVDADDAETLSLCSTFVLDLFTDRIVAEYTGRQDYADDNFEIVRLICLFYNAKCLYENNKRGIFAYFSSRRCLHLLAETPEYLFDKQLIKTRGYGNSSKGVGATAPINNYANLSIREWMIKPVTIHIEEGGEMVEKVVPNLSFIKSRALLKEGIAFNPHINVDRIRALGMVMLYRGQFIDMYEGDLTRAGQTVKTKEDDYFKQYDEMILAYENS